MSNNTPASDFTLFRVACQWFRDSFHYRGLFQTLTTFAVRCWEFLRDSTPARRRLRFGDLQFDFDHSVNTTWSNIGLRTRIRELFSGEPYQPIESDQFHEMLQAVPIDYPNFTFIDMGSGKGRALLLASDYPFRRIIGVEILPELHAIAEENIRRYSNPAQNCAQIESVCQDARDFVLPDEPTLLYIFNPFFEPVLRNVIAKVELSLREHPRRFVLLYANPLSEHIVASFPFFTKFAGTHQYSFYRPSLDSNI